MQPVNPNIHALTSKNNNTPRKERGETDWQISLQIKRRARIRPNRPGHALLDQAIRQAIARTQKVQVIMPTQTVRVSTPMHEVRPTILTRRVRPTKPARAAAPTKQPIRNNRSKQQINSLLQRLKIVYRLTEIFAVRRCGISQKCFRLARV